MPSFQASGSFALMRRPLDEISSIAEGDAQSMLSNSMISKYEETNKDYTVDPERVVNLSKMNEDLKCRICHGILMNPLECNKCENCFCMNCL